MSIDFSGTEYENEDLEPLVTTSLTREDEGEYSLRPKTLREYIGQEKAKGNLEVFLPSRASSKTLRTTSAASGSSLSLLRISG